MSKGYTGGTGYTGTTTKFCKHEGLTDIHRMKNGLFLHGGTKTDLLVQKEGRTLIVNCTGQSIQGFSTIKEPIVKTPKGFSMKSSEYKLDPDYDEFIVDWADNSPPLLKADFWKDLAEQAVKLEYTDISFCCFGGHGRTGTALVAMLIVDGVELVEAIAKVRKEHCDEAVETDSQIRYLQYVEGALQPENAILREAAKKEKEKK